MVYLLHFDKPYCHARHYLGYVKAEEGLDARVKRHKRGGGSKLIKAIVQAGIGFTVVRVWPDGSQELERRLKNQKHTPRLCPICKGNNPPVLGSTGEFND